MQVTGWAQVFVIGAFGGLLLELLRWWKLRESDNLPAYAKSPFYWGVTACMIVAGGVLAVLYGVSEPRNALMIMNVGASAPALLGALATPGAVKGDGRVTRGSARDGRSARQGALRRFLSFGG